jgi:hypothetical protein
VRRLQLQVQVERRHQALERLKKMAVLAAATRTSEAAAQAAVARVVRTAMVRLAG